MSKEMLNAAITARENAYAPYSQFRVGACIKSKSGRLYSGCNIENTSYSLTLCAESSAIAAMITAGEKQIQEMTIIASGEKICTPCGACRQRINEFADTTSLVHMYNVHQEKKTTTVSELLPHAFHLE